ncbi:MAG: hypothetical protein V3V22_04020 [Methylococcales bacterium]
MNHVTQSTVLPNLTVDLLFDLISVDNLQSRYGIQYAPQTAARAGLKKCSGETLHVPTADVIDVLLLWV